MGQVLQEGLLGRQGLHEDAGAKDALPGEVHQAGPDLRGLDEEIDQREMNAEDVDPVDQVQRRQVLLARRRVGGPRRLPVVAHELEAGVAEAQVGAVEQDGAVQVVEVRNVSCVLRDLLDVRVEKVLRLAAEDPVARANTGQLRRVPEGLPTLGIEPEENLIVDLEAGVLLDAGLRGYLGGVLGVWDAHALPVAVEFPAVERAGQCLAVHVAARSQVRAKMRAVRLDDADGARLRAEDRQVQAQDVRLLDLVLGDLVGGHDAEPPVRVHRREVARLPTPADFIGTLRLGLAFLEQVADILVAADVPHGAEEHRAHAVEREAAESIQDHAVGKNCGCSCSDVLHCVVQPAGLRSKEALARQLLRDGRHHIAREPHEERFLAASGNHPKIPSRWRPPVLSITMVIGRAHQRARATLTASPRIPMTSSVRAA
eukprot:m.229587 g.229587  ORF g.229587 m.229587 type:complete len:429 (-) comp11925_c0_seq1:1100-2386(-)